MTVQGISHLLFALSTAKFNSMRVHDRLHAARCHAQTVA
jgi:hypothetical protein